MEYEEPFLADFIVRTYKNLEKIEIAQRQGEEVYEVTQLINSFLGLIVFPQTEIGALISDEWLSEETISALKESVEENTYTRNRAEINFKNILYHLRNAIAHKHIEIQSLGKEIASLTFKDVCKDQCFKICLTIKTIRRFVQDFSENIISHEQNLSKYDRS